MRKLSHRVLLPLMAVPLFFAAIAESSTQSLNFTMERYPGYFGEYCLDMKAGETLQFSVHSSYPVRLNIHYHIGEKAHFLIDELIDNTDRNSARIPDEGEYCFQITNVEVRQSRFDLRLEYEVVPDQLPE